MKSAFVFAAAIMLFTTTAFGAGGNLPGSGTAAYPYLIEDFADFQTICGDASYWDVRDAIAGGPSLISRGIIDITVDEEVFFGSSIPRTHPRTAAGYTRSGDLILLIVDGRQVGSRGADLVELGGFQPQLTVGNAYPVAGCCQV